MCESCDQAAFPIKSTVCPAEEKRRTFLREATKEESMRLKSMQNFPDSPEKPGEIVAGIADLEILSVELINVLEGLESRLAPVLPQIPTPVNEACGDSLMYASTPLGERLVVLANRCTQSICLVRDILKNLEV